MSEGGSLGGSFFGGLGSIGLGGGGTDLEITPVPFTGQIRTWPTGQIPNSILGLIFSPPLGYRGGLIYLFPQNQATLLQFPVSLSAFDSQTILDKLRTATTVEIAINAMLAARLLIGGQAFIPPGATETGGGSGGGEGPITVNVQDINTVTQEVINNIANAVSDGITTGATEAADIARNTSQQISGALQDTTNAITNGANAMFGRIGDFLKQIGTTIFDALKAVVVDIGKGIADLLTHPLQTIQDVISKIGPVLDSIAQHIQSINDHLIQPIATFINTTVKTIADLTVAIEKDLHEGLSGLLRIPTDIANGIGSLDATLNRTVEQISKVNASVWSGILGYGGDVTAHTDLKGLADTITQGSGFKQIFTTLRDHLHLTEESGEEIGRKLTTLVPDLMREELNIVLGVFKGVFSDWSKIMLTADVGAAFLLEAAPVLAIFAIAALECIEPLHEHIKEIVRSEIPLTKLDPGTVVEALRRGIIDPKSAAEEVAVQGIDPARWKTLQDLGVYLADPSQSIDWFYRGIIPQADLDANLQAHGIQDADKTALIEGSAKLFDVSLASLLFQRGDLTEDQLRKVLSTARYTPHEADAYLDAMFRPPNPQEVLEGAANRQLLGSFRLGSSDFDTIEPHFHLAARAQGLDDLAERMLWWEHWQTGDIATWMSLYFRGIRTLTELKAVMTRHHVPPELHDDLIQAQRALIPFRTIPAMLLGGFISEADARQNLQAHGFTVGDTDRLINYARSKPKPKSTATAAQSQGESMGHARTLFLDGAITVQQYHDVLIAHGIAESAAEAEVHVAQQEEILRERKQLGQSLVDQFLTGRITRESALQQMAAANFTIAEQSKYERQMHAAKAAAAKIPGEAELNHFRLNAIISDDQYVAALEAQGYSEMWASAFLALRTLGKQPATATGG